MAMILVVDDDDSIRELILKIVRLFGHDALQARNGLGAVAIVKACPDSITSLSRTSRGREWTATKPYEASGKRSLTPPSSADAATPNPTSHRDQCSRQL